MFDSITIKKVASYDDTGVVINNLKKLNYFFGNNGSGKSTISKYLYNLTLNSPEKLIDFDNCSQIGFNPADEEILVFNSDFTDRNFIKNTELKGVFSLNQKNEAIDRQIESEQTKISNEKVYITSKTDLKTKLNEEVIRRKSELIEDCWNLRNNFSAFAKITLDFSRSKQNHFNKIMDIIRDNENFAQKDIGTLSNTYYKLYEKDLILIETELNHTIYKSLRHLERNARKLLDEVIVGNEEVNIAKLINDFKSRKWVEEGLKYIADENIKTCPFCQKETIDLELRNDFADYFDENYKKKTDELKELRTNYKNISDSCLSKLSDIALSFNPENLISNTHSELLDFFKSNYEVICAKIDSPNERKSIRSIKSFMQNISEIIGSIRENNKIYNELTDRKSEFIDEIWLFMAANSKPYIEEYNNYEERIIHIVQLGERLISKSNEAVHTSEELIKSLRTQTVNTEDAVNKINTILKCAGFEGFSIEEKEKVNNISKYYLKRGDSVPGTKIFNTLSEGEKNFISFLYFFQLCLGTDDINNNASKKKIIVIDDPVSSLDNQSLFIVSTLIHNLIQRKGKNAPDKQTYLNDNIIQVFILTHNFYFYKEVSFDRRPICTQYWHYKVTKNVKYTSITGDREKAINDDYSMLWGTVKHLKNNPPPDSALNIVIANTMRRIIESYSNFIGLGSDSWAGLLNSDKESPTYYIKCSFISMINDESHKVNAIDDLYYQKIINENPQILFDIFKEIFKDINDKHYELMMGETF